MTTGVHSSKMSELSILVAEDDHLMIMLIETILRDMGVTGVTFLSDGANALRLFRNHPDRYDVIISDWEMPELNGLNLLQQVRKLRPNLPFLMLTVQSRKKAILAAQEAGVTAYISKPFMPEDLQIKLAKIFEAFDASNRDCGISRKRDFQKKRQTPQK